LDWAVEEREVLRGGRLDIRLNFGEGVVEEGGGSLEEGGDCEGEVRWRVVSYDEEGLMVSAPMSSRDDRLLTLELIRYKQLAHFCNPPPPPLSAQQRGYNMSSTPTENASFSSGSRVK
jgi:hypothetical protein